MTSLTKEILLKTDPALKNRPYQLEALLSIFRYEKCLVKMFCGTGKSRIITNTIIHKKKELSVVVFPSLALIYQYSADYLNHSDYKNKFKKHEQLNISSEKLENMKSTTDSKEIKEFLKYKSQKIILVTYQSYKVFLDCLDDGQKIGLVCYDEAHHIVSPEYQKLVFGTDYYEEEVFFTATPQNDNGITMFDLENMEKNMCGPVAYDYTYLQGLKDEVLNQFDVCVDMYTENTNASVYEAIARAILTRGTSRILSFHSGVNGESNTDVWNFVNQTEFKTAFAKVVENEFPDKKGYYTNITFKGMDGKTPPHERKALLAALDSTPEHEIYLISSCETIGEGVDTKKANMCVFADPKASIVKIIQNIGRVVRRNSAHPLSTVLVPCWVNMENYAAAEGDAEKQDELIREQMRATNGDYAPILNVLGALRQDDPEIYEMCLNYPNKQHKEDSLAEQGFRIVDNSEDEDEDEDDDDDDNDNEEAKVYSPEEVAEMKALGETPLEIHTNDTIERFNEDSDEEPLMRLYHDEEEDVYKPIVRIDDVENDEYNTDTIIHPPNPTKRIGLTFHQNDEIQMLWRVQGELDFSKKFCTVVIECEVVKVDPMEIAIKIIAFYKKESRMPRELRKAKCPEELIEHKYYKNLQNWKFGKCPSNVQELLDKEFPGWSDKQDLLASAINDAKKIVNWTVVNKRMPKEERKRKNECNENERMEKFCYSKLTTWKNCLKNTNNGYCYDEVKAYLDLELPGWRKNNDAVLNAINDAKEIIKWYSINKRFPQTFSRTNLTNEEKIEKSHSSRLSGFKMALNNGNRGICPDEVKKLLDEHMPGWSEDQDTKSLKFAETIVQWYKDKKRYPRSFSHKTPTSDDEKLEKNHATKLTNWKNALKGKGLGKCPDDVRELLDKEIPEWRKEQEFELDAINKANEIVKWYKDSVPKRYPKTFSKKDLTEEDKIERQHSSKLRGWSNVLSGIVTRGICPDDVRELLDKEMPGWNKPQNKSREKKQTTLPTPAEPLAPKPPPKSRAKKQKALPVAATAATTTSEQNTTTPHHFPQMSAIGTLHKTYLRMRSDTLHEKFKTDPKLWSDYHATRKQTFAAYEKASIPSNRIIQELEKNITKRQKIVVDMGCGEAPIAHHFKNKNDTCFVFHNYDHQSGGDPLIQEVDISALPLENDSVEIAIMSLALWGTHENCIQYIKEAYRVLDNFGKFYISDSTKKWSPEPLTQENGGELLRTLLTANGFKIINEDIGTPFCFFECSKIY